MIAGFGLTPLALAAGPIATQAKVPAVIMAAGTSMIVEQSPFFVRTSFTLPQNTTPMAEWAAKNGIKKVVTLVSDYGPGIDAEKAFKGNSAPMAARCSTPYARRCAIRNSRPSCKRPRT